MHFYSKVFTTNAATWIHFCGITVHTIPADLFKLTGTRSCVDCPNVTRLLETTDVAICIDTGHLFLGGSDPAEVVTAAGPRVRHVHLKDIDARLAAEVRSGEITYAQAVRSGLYRPTGADRNV